MIQEDAYSKKKNGYRSFQQIVESVIDRKISQGFTLTKIFENAFDGYNQKVEKYFSRRVYYTLISFPEIDKLVTEKDGNTKHGDFEYPIISAAL